MQRESVVSVSCAATGKAVELTLCYAVANGYGCAVDCSCIDGTCSRQPDCAAYGGRDCELQKWIQEDLL